MGWRCSDLLLTYIQSANEKQIKSFYRKLSLTQHPDKVKLDASKNQTLESVNEHWVEITKAFKALTDEEVRRNFLEYGHPDGKQSFSIGIALPQFLVTDGNGKYILIFYLGLLAIVLPYYVGSWWYGSQKRTKEGILVNSAGTLFQAYTENIESMEIVEAVSGGDEFKEFLAGDKAESGLSKIEQRVLGSADPSPYVAALSAANRQALLDMDEGAQRKAFALILAYLGRIDFKDQALDDGTVFFLIFKYQQLTRKQRNSKPVPSPTYSTKLSLS
jgi:translocation protein SEC63